MMSAEMETFVKRTSICGSALPIPFSMQAATWSCSSWGPLAMSVLPLSYPITACMELSSLSLVITSMGGLFRI
ncbi:hypothetical protein PC114_g26359 [Phytophthora cactorum]|nr:hypothetical protein PC114_g26359 [Phytophthora cactorum]